MFLLIVRFYRKFPLFFSNYQFFWAKRLNFYDILNSIKIFFLPLHRIMTIIPNKYQFIYEEENTNT